MVESRLVQRAISVARYAHEGQRDKIGIDYFNGHVEPVANMVRDLAGTEIQIAAAYLHDVVEDTDTTPEQLVTMLDHESSASVALIVDALTKREVEPYGDFIYRVVLHRPAVLVKLCDVMVNLDPNRLQYVPRTTRDRLVNKYSKALPVLWNEFVKTDYNRPYRL